MGSSSVRQMVPLFDALLPCRQSPAPNPLLLNDVRQRHPHVGVRRFPLGRGLQTVARSRRRGGADGEANDKATGSRSLSIVLGLSPRVFGDRIASFISDAARPASSSSEAPDFGS